MRWKKYAGSDVDKAILEETDEIDVWELMEGCICCSLKQSFVSSVLTISGTLDPQYLIVEATGVSFLSNIIANLQKIEYGRIALLRAVASVDASVFEMYYAQQDEIFIDQIKTAGIVVLSKCESLSENERKYVYEIIRLLNSNAEIVTEHYSKKEAVWWDMLLSTYLDGRIVEQAAKSDIEWDNMSLENVEWPGPADTNTKRSSGWKVWYDYPDKRIYEMQRYRMV